MGQNEEEKSLSIFQYNSVSSVSYKRQSNRALRRKRFVNKIPFNSAETT